MIGPGNSSVMSKTYKYDVKDGVPPTLPPMEVKSVTLAAIKS